MVARAVLASQVRGRTRAGQGQCPWLGCSPVHAQHPWQGFYDRIAELTFAVCPVSPVSEKQGGTGRVAC